MVLAVAHYSIAPQDVQLKWAPKFYDQYFEEVKDFYEKVLADAAVKAKNHCSSLEGFYPTGGGVSR